MQPINTGPTPVDARRGAVATGEIAGSDSAVSWAAIIAGAAGAAALSLLLLILGTGLGMSAVSPWSMEGITATTFGFAAIAWVSFTQLAASGMGGYLAGRLRTKWTDVHTDEVFFRDTAHGFLTWAVASLLTAALLTSVVGGGVRAGAEVAGGAAGAIGTAAGGAAGTVATMAAGAEGSGEVSDTVQYFVDSLLREDSEHSAAESAREAPRPERTEIDQGVDERAAPQLGAPASQQQQLAAQTPAPAQQTRQVDREASEIPAGEVMRIFAHALRTGTLPQNDERYIGRLIAQRTNMSQQAAVQRVSEAFEELQSTLEEAENTAREAADEARAASAYTALWMVVALLLGAFTASLMAVFGGRQRDT